MIFLKKQSLADTKKLAEHLAGFLSAGDLILLQGNLGAGKTTFTRQLVHALSDDPDLIVNSPTFTILQQYTGHGLPFPVYHFDAYRLETIGAADQGFEDYIGADGLTLVEWPDYMKEILPDQYLEIAFSYDGQDRDVRLTAHGARYEKMLDRL
ncbi:tRNA (adenosine(37)-N6)-threonylcarbamoyltransferase complex ATPase subunit type 1 TsaE [Oenococcus sp.]|uniref:tRNA (adenosine(37)-N6)-threonylcarbamoyltransferase complex ATPase subunit type 1 TsaE n=1 Tax=Oenococcus sp. TaxID=1979414 RepID=UPI0039ED397C